MSGQALPPVRFDFLGGEYTRKQRARRTNRFLLVLFGAVVSVAGAHTFAVMTDLDDASAAREEAEQEFQTLDRELIGEVGDGASRDELQRFVADQYSAANRALDGVPDHDAVLDAVLDVDVADELSSVRVADGLVHVEGVLPDQESAVVWERQIESSPLITDSESSFQTTDDEVAFSTTATLADDAGRELER